MKCLWTSLTDLTDNSINCVTVTWLEFPLTFPWLCSFSLTTLEFPNFSMCSRWAVTLRLLFHSRPETSTQLSDNNQWHKSQIKLWADRDIDTTDWSWHGCQSESRHRLIHGAFKVAAPDDRHSVSTISSTQHLLCQGQFSSSVADDRAQFCTYFSVINYLRIIRIESQKIIISSFKPLPASENKLWWRVTTRNYSVYTYLTHQIIKQFNLVAPSHRPTRLKLQCSIHYHIKRQFSVYVPNSWHVSG